MIRRLILCERAATVLEFAFILPILLAFMLGIVEFGRAMWIRQTLQYAVETAARTALADSTLNTSAISSAVTANLLGLNGVNPVVTVTSSTTQITIAATVDFSMLAPGLLPVGPFVLSAQSNTPRQ